MSKVSDKATIAAMETIREKFFADPDYAIMHWFQTKDEHDAKNPVKNFPDKDYLHWVINEFHNGPKLLYVAKSRQLMVSWLLAAYGLWFALARPHTLVLWQSKKEEDAAPFIYEKGPEFARMSFILTKLPEFLRGCKGADGEFIPIDVRACGSYASLSLPNGTQILGLAQGATQVESKVPGLFISDEASLQPEFASAMAAAKPALDGDARALAVGTMRLPSDFGDAITASWDVSPDALGRGMAKFVTPEGVSGLRLHYSADPDKDPQTETGAQWKHEQLSSGAYAGGEKGWRWQQHMEINPQARAGTLCLPMFREIEKHIVIPPIPLVQQFQWSYDAGLDWGVRNPSVLQIFGMSPTGHRYMVYEFSQPGGEIGGIPGLCKIIRQNPLFNKIQGNIHADPSLWNTDQNMPGGLTTRAQIFNDNGVWLTKAKSRGQEADEVALDRLINYYWAGWDQPGNFDPLFQIFDTCKATIDTFPTLMYEEFSEALAAERSLKEKMRDLRVDSFDCFDDRTEILTNRGWKKFENVTKMDQVATLEEGELAFRHPKRIINKWYSGPMYQYESAIDFCVTPNHCHFVANQFSTIRRKNPEFKRVCVKDLPAVAWVPRTAQWSAPAASSPIPGIDADKLIAFIGFWLAEGCKDKRGHYMIVDQKNPDRELWDMIEALDVPFLYSEHGNQMGRFRVRSRELYELMPDSLAATKRIPRWILDGSTEQLLILLKWMMKGDGSIEMMRYNTISPGLANDVQEAIVKIGLCSSLNVAEGRLAMTPSGKACWGQPMYYVQMQAGRRGQGGMGAKSLLGQIKQSDMEIVDYQGMVGCVETDSGVIYVRRNGRPMWSGNSFKYAEAAWPRVPVYIPDEIPGSFQWRERAYRRDEDDKNDGDLFGSSMEI